MDSYAFGLLASVSRDEMSVVVLSVLRQPSPALVAQIFPDTDGTTQLAQLEFMTSYRCGPPVRPSYGLHAGRCSEFTSPGAGLRC